MYYKKISFSVVFSLFFVLLFGQSNLELKKIVQIKSQIPFELSGMSMDKNHGLLMIADNVVNVYQLDTSNWNLKRYILVHRSNEIKKFDLEGIDISEGKIFIENEADNTVYQVSLGGIMTPVKVNYQWYENKHNTKLEISKWQNMGYEGVAINLKDSVMFLAKERASTVKGDTSRFILTVDLKDSSKVMEKFNFDGLSKMADFTEIKYLNTNNKRYIYALERNLYFISRIDLATKEVIRYSFRSYLTDSKGMLNLYKAKSPQFGIAESFILRENEIWIGLDNNNLDILEDAPLTKKYGLTGSAPSILIFKRPTDF